MSVHLSVCLSVGGQNIENTNNQLKYVVIRSEKGAIKTFELLFEGHSTDSANTISGSCKSSHFLFLIIARLLRPSSIQIYGTKHVTY